MKTLKKSGKGPLLTALSLGLPLILPFITHAANTAWTGGGEASIGWSNPANWSNGVPNETSSVFFVTNGASPASGIGNNMVDANTTIQSLAFQSTNTAYYHTTVINPGVTLTISNNLTGNALTAGSVPAFRTVVSSDIQGIGGAMVVVATNGNISVKQATTSTTTGPRYTLDMFQLDSFTAFVSRLLVAGDGNNRPAGTLFMAKTNLLVLGSTSSTDLSMQLGHTTGSGGEGGILTLGWTNAIFADRVQVGGARSGNSQLNFNTSTYGAAAYFRGRTGGRMVSISIGDGNAVAYSGNAANGYVDLSSGVLDAQADTLIVGRNQNANHPTSSALAVAGAVGELTFAAGTLDVNTATVGYMNVNDGPRVLGTINIDGPALLNVNQSMLLGRFMRRTNDGAGISISKLNIGTKSGGGSVIVNGPINTITNTDRHSEISIYNGGSLQTKGPIGPLEYLDFNGGSLTLNLDANPTAPVCVVSNLITVANTALTVNGPALEPGQFTLIKYEVASGGAGSDFALTLPFYLEGYLSNNVANSSIDLVLTKKLSSIWNGNLSDNWDIGTSLNWKDGNTGTAKAYSQPGGIGDIVKFDDTATGSGTVNLTTSLAPVQVTIDNSTTKSYTFSGSGKLTGDSGILKSGSGVATFQNTGGNDFSGPVTISGGTLRLAGGADRLPVNGSVILNSPDVILDLNGQNQSVAAVSGSGTIALGSGTLTVKQASTFDGVISGNGQLVKSGPGILTLSGANLYSGGTTIQPDSTIIAANLSGSALGTGIINIQPGALLQIGSGASSGSVGSGVINNLGRLVFNLTNDLVFANQITSTGSVTKSSTVNTVTLATASDYTGLTTVGAGTLLVANSSGLGAPSTPGSEYSTTIANAATANLQLANDVVLEEEIQFSMKSGTFLRNPGIRSASGTNTLNGPIILTTGGSVHNFSANAGSKLILNGPVVPSTNWTVGFPYHALDGDGEGFVKNGFSNGTSYNRITNNLFKLGNGTWTLAGTNTYIGFTVISNGTLVLNGSILGTNMVKVNAAGFYVGMIVSSNGTLKGDGLIHCVVTNAGTLSPGSTIGDLTISNALTMFSGSTNIFEIGASAYDRVKGLSSVRYGGTLKVVLDRSLAGGEVFRLFEAATYEPSAFDTLELPALPAGLNWNTDSLGVDGTLKVEGGAISFAQIGRLPDGNFNLSGTSGLGSAGYRILATTNVANETSWIQIGTGNFASGAFSFSDLQATNFAQRFYKVVSP